MRNNTNTVNPTVTQGAFARMLTKLGILATVDSVAQVDLDIAATENARKGAAVAAAAPNAAQQLAAAADGHAMVFGQMLPEFEGVKTSEYAFQVNKVWDTTAADGKTGQQQAKIGMLGSGMVSSFMAAWAIGVNGDSGFGVNGYACNGRGQVHGVATQLGFHAELDKGQFKLVAKAIRDAEKLGKKHLQVIITGVTEFFAAEGSKNYDPTHSGVFLENPTKASNGKANIVLKSRLVIVGLRVVGEGDAGWVRLAAERPRYDLGALGTPSMMANLGGALNPQDVAAAAIARLAARPAPVFTSMASAVEAACEPEVVIPEPAPKAMVLEVDGLDIPEAPASTDESDLFA